MTRAALPSIVRRALGGQCGAGPGERILVAVSGGPDSMALLDVVARLGREVVAHGVDHGLRPEASGELDLAEAHADKLGVPFARTRLKVAKGGNVQARAREARWSALCRAAATAGASLIATAHHADDRAETVLIRLLHGAGPRGLAVLTPRARAPAPDAAVDVIRPLLLARRVDIEAYVARHTIPFAVDPSNADPRYLRTRVRRELLPLLVALSPGIVHHLGALADQLAADFDATASSLALPRATQQASARLLSASSSTGRIWLPSGRVLTVERGAEGEKNAARAESRKQRDRIRTKSTKPERIRPSIKGIGTSSLKGPRSS